MRKGLSALSITAICVIAMVSASAAQDDPAATSGKSSTTSHGKFGIGVIVGEPTGLSGKMWASQNTGFDIGLAWSFSGDGHFHIHGDYLFHKFNVFDVSEGSLPLYFGIGGRILLRDNADDKIGIRIPVGIEYYFEGAPISVFGELVPILDLAPDTEFEINGGLGCRFYF